MHLSADISSALQQIEAVKKGIDDSDDAKLQMQTTESLNTILGILTDPVFRTIAHVQESLFELGIQLGQHPSMLPNDFDIDVSGNLVLSLNGGEVMYDSSAPASPDKSTSTAGELEARPQSQNSKTAANADLYATDYAQIQAIELVNDGTGLGFGIIGARNSGVIVKTILPGGVADRDGRLRSGDHILQIGDVNLHEMVSEQVAAVLRQSGTHVRLVVVRPIEQSLPTPQYALEPGSAVVPTRVLVDPAELERYLISTGYPEIFGESSTASTPQTTTEDERFVYRGETSMLIDPSIDLEELLALPETEKLQVELKKDANGLGITIAGYVCEKEELSGIFVKSVSPGSAADLSGRIRVNDRIIEVDGQSLQGYSNHQAVELLKKSGQVVNLRLERYLRGPKYEQLQQAIAANANEKLPTSSAPGTPCRAPLPTPVVTSSSAVELEDETLPAPEAFMMTTPPSSSLATTTTLSSFGAGKQLVAVRDSIEGTTKIVPTEVVQLADKQETAVHAKNASLITRHKYYTDPDLSEEMEADIVRKWQKIVGADMEVIVAQIKKFAVGGLGISLEGTVDVEGGREVRPHHYIRSILPDGPVGVNGVLRSGDELLEVNGERLLGMNHLEVVAILKELPLDVRMVCGRSKATTLLPFSDDTLKKLSNNFENLLPATDRLVKAKSDGSLATAGSVADADNVAVAAASFNKLKSRSLEPLTGLAMWSSQPQIIELLKGDRGLGFSILDYQDPLDSNDTLIVIRSLVPGGVAQLDGRLIPGDRLLFVNSINLENASLDQAVQALKGAPKGVVRIGVAKPLPMTDNSLKACSNASTTSDETLEQQQQSPPALPTAAPPPPPIEAKGPEPDLIPDWRN
ncbi:patj homolog [Drosophila sulfurigaster albostrigata]|uniref:Patj homolog n=1 Tax=Drosophila albomicans TaxID=7291 RepID=A0A6P8WR25_DROAB|nr:patj homolog [Drosophila albomicans]XP_062136758.1 patj homolog [Drosophila sulfurigaster albostrigata]